MEVPLDDLMAMLRESALVSEAYRNLQAENDSLRKLLADRNSVIEQANLVLSSSGGLASYSYTAANLSAAVDVLAIFSEPNHWEPLGDVYTYVGPVSHNPISIPERILRMVRKTQPILVSKNTAGYFF